MAAELLDHPRILGFKLQLLVQRFSPDDERLFPLYELVMAKGKRLLLHVGTGPVGNEFVGVAPFRRLLARYPDLPAIVAHMGALEYGAVRGTPGRSPRDSTWTRPFPSSPASVPCSISAAIFWRRTGSGSSTVRTSPTSSSPGRMRSTPSSGLICPRTSTMRSSATTACASSGNARQTRP